MPTPPRYSLKKNESEARERLHALWEGSSLGRPALQVLVKNPDYEVQPWEPPITDPKRLDFSPEWQAYHAVNTVEGSLYLAEAMPGYAVRRRETSKTSVATQSVATSGNPLQWPA